MRRYLPLLLLSFFLVVLVIAGTTLLAGYARDEKPENKKSIVVYTTIPIEQVNVIDQEFEKAAGVRVTLIPVTPAELTGKIKQESEKGRAADVILAYQSTLMEAKKSKLLAPYASEFTDMVPARFSDENGCWTGVWYDPVIFAVNKDFAKKLPRLPSRWADLAENKYRLVITDFCAAEASANLLYTMAEVNGQNETLAYLAKLHPNIVQYAKLLMTPPRMVGMGEADIAIAVQSETLRYINNGFPLQIIYPEDGTAYLLTGVALANGAPHSEEAGKFIDWLLHDQAQKVMQNNQFYFVPSNPSKIYYKEIKLKSINLFDSENTPLTTEQKASFLDKWVQTVRLSSR